MMELWGLEEDWKTAERYYIYACAIAVNRDIKTDAN